MSVSATLARPVGTGSPRSQRGLDWLNFFVADVQTAFGPFIAVELSVNGWTRSAIGAVLTINGVVGILAQAPGGALVDAVRAKRAVIGVCLGLIAAGALIFARFPAFWLVVIAQALHGATGAVAQTALYAIGLGLVGHRVYHRRVGRSERWNTLGNAATAMGMGALGHFLSPAAPFYAAALLCVPAGAALFTIRGADIDYRRARGAERRKEPKAARFRELLANRRLRGFALCVFLFQFADASILPLASERLTEGARGLSELVTAALVAVPQVVTAIIAGTVAARSERWGRRPLLLGGFAVLPVRAALFAVVGTPFLLPAIQILGGATTAVVGIMIPLIVADITQGTGRYNAALGVVLMCGLIGASLSTTVTGFLAQHLGFGAAFAGIAVVAALATFAVWLLVPETSQEALRED
ncbi:MAG TPA: MFS transporter [Acetobacteraceae bacterium]|nr:MFS transporter [Acetobacteraceae bacterium]